MNPVLEKIKKLLRMRRGGTQSEVETAEALAEIIAARNGIDISTVSIDDERPALPIITHRSVLEFATSTKRPAEAKYAMALCAEFFNVEGFTQRSWLRSKIIFVGTDWDLDVACHVFQFLVSQSRWYWRNKRGRVRAREQFMYGLFIGLFTKLENRFPKQPEPASDGLIVSPKGRRLRYIQEQFGALTTPKAANPKKGSDAALYRGIQMGREIEIRPGVKGGKPNTREALPPSREGRLLSRGEAA